MKPSQTSKEQQCCIKTVMYVFTRTLTSKYTGKIVNPVTKLYP